MKYCNGWILAVAQEIDRSWECVEDYAKHIKVHQSSVLLWLKGEREPSLSSVLVVQKLSAILVDLWSEHADSEEIELVTKRIALKSIAVRNERAGRNTKLRCGASPGSEALARMSLAEVQALQNKLGSTTAEVMAWSKGKVRPCLNTRLKIEDLAGIPANAWVPQPKETA